jgi:hypothetical protein
LGKLEPPLSAAREVSDMTYANRFLVFASCTLAAVSLASCGDGGGKAQFPPTLGEQIERMGRAAINTALSKPFASSADRGAAEDAYNAASDPSQWGAMFGGEIATNLAIFDGLDRNCGNQLLAGDTAEPGRYDALAGVLADDQLYVNTDSGICETYLAVEANALGITNEDCGGRTPLYDTIDVSYSVLAAGTLEGVTDAIPEDTDSDASIVELPFYAEPND